MPQQESEHPEGWSPRMSLLVALFLYVSGIVLYFYLRYEEAKGTGFSVNVWVALLYNLGGKWLVSGFTAAGATLFLIVGILGIRKPRD